MKIVTWNVNSLNAREPFVGLYLDREAPDVLAIQELKLDAHGVPRALFESRGYHVAMHAQATWNGVLIASKTQLEDVEVGLEPADDGQARVIAATTAGVRVINVYCPQGQAPGSTHFEYKLRFFDALIEHLTAALAPTRPAVVLGDFNIAPEPRDIYDPVRLLGCSNYHPEEHARWAKLLALGLVDVVKPRVPPNTYSFWDYRGGAFHKKMGMRIDHLLCTPPIAARVDDAFIQRDWRKKQDDPMSLDPKRPLKLNPSDHAPVGITLRDT